MLIKTHRPTGRGFCAIVLDEPFGKDKVNGIAECIHEGCDARVVLVCDERCVDEKACSKAHCDDMVRFCEDHKCKRFS